MKKKPAKKPTLSKKPSLARAPRFKEAEKIIKERKGALKAAEKSSPVKKTPAKKPSAKKPSAKKGAKDPMWKHLATALKKTK